MAVFGTRQFLVTQCLSLKRSEGNKRTNKLLPFPSSLDLGNSSSLGNCPSKFTTVDWISCGWDLEY